MKSLEFKVVDLTRDRELKAQQLSDISTYLKTKEEELHNLKKTD